MSAMWYSSTKYAKETIQDRLDKNYWGKVYVSNGVKNVLAKNEWFREKFRRELKRIGADIWVQNKQSKDNKQSKRLMYFDNRVSKGDGVTATIYIDGTYQFYLHCKVFQETRISEF